MRVAAQGVSVPSVTSGARRLRRAASRLRPAEPSGLKSLPGRVGARIFHRSALPATKSPWATSREGDAWQLSA